jgi:hypothetical protein
MSPFVGKGFNENTSERNVKNAVTSLGGPFLENSVSDAPIPVMSVK